MPKKINSDVIQKIVQLNAAGKNSKEIALDVGLCFDTVRKQLKRLKLNKAYICSCVKKVNRNCPNCGKEYNTINKFCSRSCAATYNNSGRVTEWRRVEIERKKKISLKYAEYKGAERLKKISEDKLLSEDFSLILTSERRRKRVIIEQKGKCNKCGVAEWMGSPIPFELEHIDGNNKNHERGNLEALCPNCHSITDTWRGRNKKWRDKSKPVTLEQLKDAYVKTGNVRQALLSLELAAKGGNYKRMYKALDAYDISYKIVINRKTKKV